MNSKTVKKKTERHCFVDIQQLKKSHEHFQAVPGPNKKPNLNNALKKCNIIIAKYVAK